VVDAYENRHDPDAVAERLAAIREPGGEANGFADESAT
jgi:hypothetical protein